MPDRYARPDEWQAKRWLEIRNRFFNEHESVSGTELAAIAGTESRNGSTTASEWKRSGRVFSVCDGSEARYPVFQLAGGRPLPVVAGILSIFSERLTPWQVAIWITAPNAWLGDWRCPAELLRAEPDRVLEAARREVAEKVL